MFGLPFCKSCIFSVRTTAGPLRFLESVMYKENIHENRIHFPVVEMETSPQQLGTLFQCFVSMEIFFCTTDVKMLKKSIQTDIWAFKSLGINDQRQLVVLRPKKFFLKKFTFLRKIDHTTTLRATSPIPVQKKQIPSGKNKETLHVNSLKKKSTNKSVRIILSGYVTDEYGMSPCIEIIEGEETEKPILNSMIEEADC